MKKKVLASIIGIVVAFGVGMGIYQMSGSSSAATLSVEEAKELAQSQFPGEVVEVEFEKRGNKAVYEMEIKGDGHEYELVLDGETGEVLRLEEKELTNTKLTAEHKTEVTSENKKETDTSSAKSNTDVKSESKVETETEHDDSSSSKNSNSKDDDTDNTNQPKQEKKNHEDDDKKASSNNDDDNDDKNGDSKEEVVHFTEPKKGKLPIIQSQAIAIAKAKLNFEAKVVEIELNDDDERLYYDIEMEGPNHEAEIEVDAYTGNIISISTEREDD
ncbi:PepSY domain-containing protein [Salinibacillus xinjiangensis]|uniref:PepSY domain-containing protein n=1 Tax=Salinibacillus xinjiangensis TaxID=1229268 RepID=A0A6G1X8R4_9BACI|nr:PepSY domain-containing protein [Salinibacillus xinjiangensis]MRG87332.1 hypothetical protein [Salinibacillus xinjiangensis]